MLSSYFSFLLTSLLSFHLFSSFLLLSFYISVSLHFNSLIIFYFNYFRDFLSPQKAEADRNALLALGMSVSKKNLDTVSTKKTAIKEISKKRKAADLESTIAALEEKVEKFFFH